MAGLILVRNVVGELRPKRTLAASRGFLAAARLSCKSRYGRGTRSKPFSRILRGTPAEIKCHSGHKNIVFRPWRVLLGLGTISIIEKL